MMLYKIKGYWDRKTLQHWQLWIWNQSGRVQDRPCDSSDLSFWWTCHSSSSASSSSSSQETVTSTCYLPGIVAFVLTDELSESSRLPYEGEGETLKVLKQGSPCAGRTTTGETRELAQDHMDSQGAECGCDWFQAVWHRNLSLCCLPQCLSASLQGRPVYLVVHSLYHDICFSALRILSKSITFLPQSPLLGQKSAHFIVTPLEKYQFCPAGWENRSKGSVSYSSSSPLNIMHQTEAGISLRGRVWGTENRVLVRICLSRS